MIQYLVYVRTPAGLDPAYLFRERELTAFGLNTIPASLEKKYEAQYRAVRPLMLPLRVINTDLDRDKLCAVWGLEDIHILNGDRLAARYLCRSGGRFLEMELPYAARHVYEKRKTVKSLVWQQTPVLSFGEDEGIWRFFQTLSGKRLKPLQFFRLEPQTVVDWNAVFPDRKLPLEAPSETEGLFYYYT